MDKINLVLIGNLRNRHYIGMTPEQVQEIKQKIIRKHGAVMSQEMGNSIYISLSERKFFCYEDITFYIKQGEAYRADNYKGKKVQWTEKHAKLKNKGDYFKQL